MLCYVMTANNSPYLASLVVVVVDLSTNVHTNVAANVTVASAKTLIAILFHVSSVAADCCCCCCCCATSTTTTPVSAADYDDGNDKYQTTDNDDRRDDNEESFCCTGDVFDTVHVFWIRPSTNVHLTPHCCIRIISVIVPIKTSI